MKEEQDGTPEALAKGILGFGRNSDQSASTAGLPRLR